MNKQPLAYIKKSRAKSRGEYKISSLAPVWFLEFCAFFPPSPLLDLSLRCQGWDGRCFLNGYALMKSSEAFRNYHQRPGLEIILIKHTLMRGMGAEERKSDFLEWQTRVFLSCAFRLQLRARQKSKLMNYVFSSCWNVILPNSWISTPRLLGLLKCSWKSQKQKERQ